MDGTETEKDKTKSMMVSVCQVKRTRIKQAFGAPLSYSFK